MEEYEQIYGTVDGILFENEENGYAVMKVTDWEGNLVTVTGCMPSPACGEQIEATGFWKEHKSYGRQFIADSFERLLPDSQEGIFKFLAGGAVKGIGPATAAAIVNTFGDKALDVLAESPEKLAQIKGISLKKARECSEYYKRTTFLRRLMEYIGKIGIKPYIAMKLYRFYGAECLDILKDNPFILTEPCIGCNFQEADAMARLEGIEPDDKNRVCAALVFELRYSLNRGHCFIPAQKLAEATARLLGIEIETALSALDEMTGDGRLVKESFNGYDAVYLPELYEAETYCAERLVKMKDRVLIITGGPGTGKSTLIKQYLNKFEENGIKCILAAPTGRAAKRMEEVTEHEASTIHRLLEAGISEDGYTAAFSKGEEDPLVCGALIIDECSMMDVMLLEAVLKALPVGATLILVGDADQLPPVGPGNVFKAVIASGEFETVRLTEVHRQNAESCIIKNANLINKGEYPDFGANNGDFFRLKRMEGASSIETICELCSKRLPEKMHIMPEEIQVLTPTRLGELGTVSLNTELQKVLNPASDSKSEKLFGERVFREGDRVMQVRNNYDIPWRCEGKNGTGEGIFNGDIGYVIKNCPENECLEIDFDGRTASYSYQYLNELEHAWACTVHKSQGSEYRAAILVLSPAGKMLLTRQILYTAVTRARELMILVGDENIAKQMIDNSKIASRYSFLRARISRLCGGDVV